MIYIRKIILLLIVFAIGVVLPGLALEGTTRNSLNLDDTIKLEEPQYTQNTRILVAPIFTPTSKTVPTEEWLRGIYYYSVARLGYPDMPFHYAIDSNGNVYRTNMTGEEAKVDIEETGNNAIIVAYLADPEDVNFTDEGEIALSTLLVDIANSNGIEAEDIDIANLRFNVDFETRLSSLETRMITGKWDQTMVAVKKFVQKNYKPIERKYRVKVSNVKMPDNQVKPGQTAIVEITLKNIGTNTVYADTDSALFATTSDGKLSKFYMNNIWVAQSQIAIMPEGEVLRPDEEKTFQMKFSIPLYFGTQAEDFVIKDGLGRTIDGTKFSISMQVGSIDDTVVEILETGTGYLNVRSADSGNASVIGKVSPGERYIQEKQGEYGYVQIDLGDGKKGWVSQKYIRVIN